jgi:hypothetical protein
VHAASRTAGFQGADMMVMGWLITVLVDGLVMNLTDLDADSQESHD